MTTEGRWSFSASEYYIFCRFKYTVDSNITFVCGENDEKEMDGFICVVEWCSYVCKAVFVF